MCIFYLLFQDIVAKMLSFSQQRPRAVCILSGSGTVSSVTLRQPASSTPTVTYEVVALDTFYFSFFKKNKNGKILDAMTFLCPNVLLDSLFEFLESQFEMWHMNATCFLPSCLNTFCKIIV